MLHDPSIADIPDQADALRALWRPGRQGFHRLGFADDAMLIDASAGALTLRSFAARRDADMQGLTEPRALVQELFHPLGAPSAGRIWLQAKHGADGPFGPATHHQLGMTIALELTGQPLISDIWQIRDQGALLRRLGIELADWARAHPGKPITKPEKPCGPITDPWGDTLADLIQVVMDGDLTALHRAYDPGVELWLPSGERRAGPAAADQFWLSLRSALPTATFTVSSATGLEDTLSPPRAAVRWSLTGSHDGWGRFGPPSGAQICVLGITQVEFGPRGIRREWTVIDELAVWRQITAQRG